MLEGTQRGEFIDEVIVDDSEMRKYKVSLRNIISGLSNAKTFVFRLKRLACDT